MNYETFLVSVGLTSREAKVYLCLLERGDLTISKLSYLTQINRVALYDLLPRMKELGYIQIIQMGKRKLYRAESPDKFEMLFEKQIRNFESSISTLKDIYSNKKQKPTITYREGTKGVRETFDDVAYSVPVEGTFYRYTSRVTDIPESRSEKYRELKKKKRFGRFVITGEVKGKKKGKSLDREMRLIPSKTDLFEDDVSLLIYEDKVAFIDYEHNLTFTISSPKIARFQKKLFMLLFKRL